MKISRLPYPIIIFCFYFHSVFSATQVFYASPSGSGSTCSFEQPGSLISVQTVVRTKTPTMNGDIIVYLFGGRYELNAPFTLNSVDGGKNGYKVSYRAYGNDKPIISGGQQVSNWSLVDTQKNIYAADVGVSIDTRQIYVNGTRAVRARSDDNISWNATNTGYICPDYLSSWGNISNIEIVSCNAWRCSRGPISSIVGGIAVMADPYWTNTRIRGNSVPSTWIENAYELLNREGEWYLNRQTGKLYYKPRLNENMNNAVIILPKLETLISGTDLHNFEFRGLTFSYATWLLPNSVAGFAHRQADGMNDGTFIPGNITFSQCSNLLFVGNAFEHLGADGLQLSTGCSNNELKNNIFRDISGSAIAIGSGSSENDLHTIQNNLIDSNLIRDVAVEFLGSVGIFVGYTEQTIITHNELRNLPYTAISMGWGWKHNVMGAENCDISYNLIDSFLTKLSDGGGIYTLSKQNGTRVHHNFLNHQFGEHGMLYPDEGSSDMRWDHNVMKNVQDEWLYLHGNEITNCDLRNEPLRDTIENNYYDNGSATTQGCEYVIRDNLHITNNNWPIEALEIMKNAGRSWPYDFTIIDLLIGD